MTTYAIQANKRDIVGKKVKQLRKQGFIPAVIYGHDFKNENLSLNLINFNRIFKEAGTSNLVDLTIDDNQPTKVLFKEPVLHVLTNQPIHLDIYRIKMTEKLTTEIPLEFINESPAVVDLEGSLVKNFDALEVECLPADLVPNFEVDLSLLKTFDDNIKISDLKIPSTIEVKVDVEEVVALVMPPRSEEELAELEAEVVEAVDQVEVTGEKPAEGAESEASADNAKPDSEKPSGSNPETPKSE